MLYCVAIAIISFAAAAVMAISSELFDTITTLLAEIGTILGFLCIITAILVITKIAKSIAEILQVMKWGPEPSEDDNSGQR